MKFTHAQQAARRGAGMAEVVVATVIVGMMIVAALEAAGQVFRTQRLNADKLTAIGLAQDLMAEIMSMPYTDPQNPGGAIGVDSGESSASRATYDDVDDYHGLNSSNAIKNRDGTTRTGYTTGWSQTAAVAYFTPTDPLSGSGTDTGLKRIIVTVTKSSVSTQLMGLRFKEGVLEQSLAVASVGVAWVGIEFRIGAATRSQFAAAPLANLSPDAN